MADNESLGELIVQISADLTKLQSGLNQAQAQIAGFSDNSDVQTKKIQTSWGQAILNVGESLEHFSSGLRSVGRELNQLSGIAALAGVTLTGPFLLAFKNADSSILSVHKGLADLGDVAQRFQEVIAQAVMPVINRLTASLNGLLQAFLKIPAPIRDAFLQGMLLNGMFLVAAAGALKFSAEVVNLVKDITGLTGKFLTFIGVLATTNPALLAIAIGVAALIALMIKFQQVANIIISAFEVVFRFLWTGVLSVKLAFEEALLGISNGIIRLVNLLAQMPGPTQRSFQQMIVSVNEFRRAISGAANQDMNGIITQSQKVGQILTTGTSDWAKGFNNLKNTIKDFFTAFQQGSTNVVASHKTMQSAFQGTVGALGTLGQALDSAAAVNKKFALAAKIVAIGMAIMNTAQGVTKALADYPFPYDLIVAGIVGAAGAIQIGTIAAQGFATGTDTVPAMLSPGEMVVPRNFSDAIRAGDLALSGKGSNGAQGSNQGDGGINIYLNATITHPVDIEAVAKQIAFQTNRELRYLRPRAI